MLRRLDGTTAGEDDPTQAAIARAKSLHARYHAFIYVQFEELLRSEVQATQGAERKTKDQPQQKNLGREATRLKGSNPTQVADTIIA